MSARSLRLTAMVAAVVVAAVAVVAFISTRHRSGSSPTAAASPTTTATTTTALRSSIVPVVECPTERGAPSTPQAALADTIATELPPATAAQLAFYSDDTRSMTPILGPRGWTCKVLVGADGSTVVTVAPPGSPLPTFSQASTPRLTDAITAQSGSACQSCVYGIACAFVPHADTQLGYPGMPCGAPKPAREQVTWLNGSPNSTAPVRSDAIAFEDPPGVAGNGSPSGGADPANGLVLYDYTGLGHGSASTETCTLPASEHAVCTAVLNDFDTRAWLMH